MKKITGTNGHDLLTGGNGDNVIKGRAGNDTIDGGGGKNKLVGGKGADTFVFDFEDLGNSINKIKDFKSGVDHIEIRGYSDYFDVLPDLSTFDFTDLGTYDNGRLAADMDGLGGYGPISIAKFVGNPVLSEGDFILS